MDECSTGFRSGGSGEKELRMSRQEQFERAIARGYGSAHLDLVKLGSFSSTPGRSAASRVSANTARFNFMKPEAAWGAVQIGFAEILDLRTGIERRRHGAPPGARPVSLVKHIASPEGPDAIYLCQHAIRSKATLRHGAAEVAGGFAAWKEAGLPVEDVKAGAAGSRFGREAAIRIG
jgi:rhodanese-related sulfurtransferase